MRRGPAPLPLQNVMVRKGSVPFFCTKKAKVTHAKQCVSTRVPSACAYTFHKEGKTRVQRRRSMHR
eukprot:4902366-Prorocentrum_lima.AAC.1